MEATGERFIPNAGMGIDIELEHMHRYYAVAPLLKGKCVLDAACGVGYGTKIISQYATHVTGIDIDQESILYAKNLYNNSNIDFLQMSIDEMTFEKESFDAIISFETIEHISQNQQYSFLKKAAQLLKNSGYLIISTPDLNVFKEKSKGVYSNPFHIKEYDRKDFSEILQKYFSFVEIHVQERMNCSVISGLDKRQINDMPEISMGHYLIAVCAQEPVSLPLGSVFLPSSKSIESNYKMNQAQAEKIAEQLTMIQERDETIQRHIDMVHERDAKIAEQLAMIQERDETIQRHIDMVHERDAKIAEQLTMIQERDETIQRHIGMVHERDAKIAEQLAMIQDRDEIIQRHIGMVHERDAKIVEQLEIIQERDEEIKEKEAVIQARDEIIRRYTLPWVRKKLM